ncbi:hypothetical protein HK405_008922 [Cladochytrium tenue]|nr:hypothetical protein HK405_008922 [Cladochytrium tenue]
MASATTTVRDVLDALARNAPALLGRYATRRSAGASNISSSRVSGHGRGAAFGLVVGDPGDAATGVVVTVVATRATLALCRARGANVVVALRAGPKDGGWRLAAPSVGLEAARAGVAVVALGEAFEHAASDAVADLGARVLGLASAGGASGGGGGTDGGRRRRFYSGAGGAEEVRFAKLTTFVPAENRAKLLADLWGAGAGMIGEYEQCSFSLQGMGSFRGSEVSRPVVGQAAVFEEAAEQRVEVVVADVQLEAVVRALRAAHPYEEPAFDVVLLENTHPSVTAAGVHAFGWGVAGDVAVNGSSWAELQRRVREHFFGGAEGSALMAEPEDAAAACVVRRAAFVPGSAEGLVDEVVESRCDAVVTGELSFDSALVLHEAGVRVAQVGFERSMHGLFTETVQAWIRSSSAIGHLAVTIQPLQGI